MKTGNTIFIYRNDIEKDCFQYDSAYSDSKDLIKRTQSDKILKENAFNIAKNRKYDEYQRQLASMVYKFFGKKFRGSCIKENKELANELYKPIIRKFKK